jgi:signal transduction histidine kinase
MTGFLIIAIIIFALVKRHNCQHSHRSRGRDKWSRQWDRWVGNDQTEPGAEDGWEKWSQRWREFESWSREGRHRLSKWERRAARRFESNQADREREAAKGAGNDRDTSSRAGTHKSSTAGASSPRDDVKQTREARSKSEADRTSYERARKRATQEAGFYLHLMWYGIIIGFLLILNLVVSPSLDWWIFPALGWGVGLASHFGAVYGWRWIQDRVFEPAIKREVQREVTLEKEVLRSEKQASLDELTATFAHEIRNPIAAAKSLVQQMGEDPTSNENVEYAKVALDELARVERSVSHLLKYAKEEDYNLSNVNLASVLDGALTQMRGKLEAKQINVSRNYISGPTIRADADKLRHVFTNVIDNAIDAMESNSGERQLELGITRTYPESATVMIRDNGCGIPDDKLSKIFNPFYTTKQSGTGLGMGIAKKVMEAHRGRIEVRSKVGSGTEFSLSIPLSDARRASAESENSSPAKGSQDRSSTDEPTYDSTAQAVRVDDDHATAELRLEAGTRQ